MIAIAKHGVLSVRKSKDKHIEINSHRRKPNALVTLAV
jgi:hypothetical protein